MTTHLKYVTEQYDFYMKWSHICMYLRMYSVRVCTCLPGRPTNALMLRSMGLSFSGNSGTFTLLLSLWLGGWLQRGAIVSWQYTYLHVYCKMSHERYLKRHTPFLEDFSMFKTWCSNQNWIVQHARTPYSYLASLHSHWQPLGEKVFRP